jgi:hypothetical protein
MKVPNKILLLAGIMLWLWANSVMPEDNGSLWNVYLEHKEKYFEDEKNRYLKSDLLAEGFFRIGIFDGFVYFPNRFVLISRGTNYHHFNSSSMGSKIPIHGTITVGHYKDFAPGASYRLARSYVDKATGLNVLLYEFEIKSEKYAPMKRIDAVIHDNEQYISIADDNNELWELILSKYEK